MWFKRENNFIFLFEGFLGGGGNFKIDIRKIKFNLSLAERDWYFVNQCENTELIYLTN